MSIEKLEDLLKRLEHAENLVKSTINIPHANSLSKHVQSQKKSDYEMKLDRQRSIIETSFLINRNSDRVVIPVSGYSDNHDGSYDMLPEIQKELMEKGYKYTYRYFWHGSYAKYNEWVISAYGD